MKAIFTTRALRCHDVLVIVCCVESRSGPTGHEVSHGAQNQLLYAARSSTACECLSKTCSSQGVRLGTTWARHVLGRDVVRQLSRCLPKAHQTRAVLRTPDTYPHMIGVVSAYPVPSPRKLSNACASSSSAVAATRSTGARAWNAMLACAAKTTHSSESLYPARAVSLEVSGVGWRCSVSTDSTIRLQCKLHLLVSEKAATSIEEMRLSGQGRDTKPDTKCAAA